MAAAGKPAHCPSLKDARESPAAATIRKIYVYKKVFVR